MNDTTDRRFHFNFTRYAYRQTGNGKGYDIVIVSTLTGDIKEYVDTVRDRRTAQARVRKANARAELAR